MVEITIRGGAAAFEPRGWSRIWTLRRRVVIPLSAIRLVRRAPADLVRGIWHGWRLPGTQLPGVIIAGAFRKEGEWTFWDVRGKGARAIEVRLSGTRFSRLVVDVADPDAEVARLNASRGR
jgi:hypothetical protein